MNDSLLQQLNAIPPGLVDCPAEQLHTLLPQPTLIHLEGKRQEPLFISVLLHGNEPTGLLAVQALLKKYQDRVLPRSLSIFFGNVQAAAKQQRRLDGQVDFNRIWPGTLMLDCPETEMAQQIVDIMTQRNVFASVDIHNNTGLNPHYGCINRIDNRFLQLATLFARFVVYFTSPKGVQSGAFAEHCPALTLECGRPNQEYGVQHAFEFIDSCLNLAELVDHPIHPQDIDLFHTVAQIKVKDDIDFSFNDEAANFLLSKDLETLNFTEVPAGTIMGVVQDKEHLPIVAKDEQGRAVTSRFFTIDNDQLVIKRKTMPSMLTLDERVIRQDCLCYLMERFPLATDATW